MLDRVRDGSGGLGFPTSPRAELQQRVRLNVASCRRRHAVDLRNERRCTDEVAEPHQCMGQHGEMDRQLRQLTDVADELNVASQRSRGARRRPMSPYWRSPPPSPTARRPRPGYQRAPSRLAAKWDSQRYVRPSPVGRDRRVEDLGGPAYPVAMVGPGWRARSRSDSPLGQYAS